jgi:hypothetical protein
MDAHWQLKDSIVWATRNRPFVISHDAGIGLPRRPWVDGRAAENLIIHLEAGATTF